jgi:cytochrome c biogenesis protein CcmG/thiol:disulfide interchange protein DsbE
MNKRLVYFAPLLAAFGIGLILYTAIGKDPTKLETARKDDPFPSFSLADLHQPERVRTDADLAGKIRLVNVWATWCPSCKAEHGYLQALSDSGVNIVGLNYKDERTAALQWLQQLGNPYEFVIDDPKGSLGFDLGVYGAPETYVVDALGVVHYRHVGEVNERVWASTLKPMLTKLGLKGL